MLPGSGAEGPGIQAGVDANSEWPFTSRRKPYPKDCAVNDPYCNDLEAVVIYCIVIVCNRAGDKVTY